MEMNPKELVKVLLYCGNGGDCDSCCHPCHGEYGEFEWRCLGPLLLRAATQIERLTAENAKAEAERDAALADLADARSCKTCKYACDTRDCSSCKSKTCKCRECHLDKNAWEWRGALDAPEEGDKHE